MPRCQDITTRSNKGKLLYIVGRPMPFTHRGLGSGPYKRAPPGYVLAASRLATTEAQRRALAPSYEDP